MADEEKVDGTTEGAKPVVDTEDIVAKLHAKLKDDMAQFVRTEPKPDPEPVVTTPPPHADPLGNLIREAVDPQINAVTARAAAAEDKADFYSDPSNEEARTHRDEIEKLFSNLFKAGRAMPRSDIWKFIKGRDFDKFADAREERKKKQIERAAADVDMGAGAGRRDIGTGGKAAYDMNEDELNKAVAGVSF